MRIYKTYDALHYPLMFCRGKDGYQFYLNQVNATTGQLDNWDIEDELKNKELRLENDTNYIHQFKQLFNQFLWIISKNRKQKTAVPSKHKK